MITMITTKERIKMHIVRYERTIQKAYNKTTYIHQVSNGYIEQKVREYKTIVTENIIVKYGSKLFLITRITTLINRI